MLGLLETQPVLRLQIEHLELQHRAERWPPAFGSVNRSGRCHENRPKKLEVHDLLKLLQRIALCRKLLEPFLDAPKPGLARQWLSPSVAKQILAHSGPNGEVSGSVHLLPWNWSAQQPATAKAA